MKARIQPDTRLATLLEAYPELAPRLMTALPALAQVRSGVLRRSLLEGTTLEQAARLAGLPAAEFVAVIRSWAGEEREEPACGPGGHAPLPPSPRPAWAVRFTPRLRIDADAMLAAGVHPAGAVKQGAAALEAGEMVVLTSGFCPSPLIQRMRQEGYEAWTGEVAPGRWETCFTRKDAAAGLTES